MPDRDLKVGDRVVVTTEGSNFFGRRGTVTQTTYGEMFFDLVLLLDNERKAGDHQIGLCPFHAYEVTYLLPQEEAVPSEPPVDYVWRKRRLTGYYHHFPSEHSKSRCGMIVYPIVGKTKDRPEMFERCRSCEKKRLGYAHNQKGVVL